ncbi:hypothetical protein BJV82DRAFT_164896 [Fennellomyces sp. T-0311]|nr:hypothetical protein BJV82DRAFT_164896 [Fennellomyces sp. T-0311]
MFSFSALLGDTPEQSMSSNAFKLYWPSHISSKQPRRPGYLVGWHTAPTTTCVAAVMADIELEALQQILSEFCASGEYSEFAHINRVCKAPPSILGALIHSSETTSFHSNPRVYSSPWITVMLDDAYVPIPVSFYQNGSEHPVSTFEVIFYQQPNPKHLQFLALDPLDLDISSKEPPKHQDVKQLATAENLSKILNYSFAMVGNRVSINDDMLSVLVQSAR